jgi:hypothetical protein
LSMLHGWLEPMHNWASLNLGQTIDLLETYCAKHNGPRNVLALTRIGPTMVYAHL